jgi:multiple sugar transport system permease protein
MRRVLAFLYRGKTSGVIRAYDVKSPWTQFLAVFFAVMCILLILIVLLPILWVMLSGFKNIRELTRSTSFFPEEYNFDIYRTTWDQLRFTRFYINSGLVLVGGVFCAVIFNGMLAYVLGVLRPPGHKYVFALVMWTLLIPPTTGLVAQFVNIRRLLDVLAGMLGVNASESFIAITPLWFIMGANAFWLVLFKSFFEEIPKDYVEAARIDGCTNGGIFFRIILPLSKPIIIVVGIFAATAAWSDFLLPNLLLNNGPWETVMVRLFQFRDAIRVNESDQLRAVVFSIIPPMIIFAVFQKKITSGIAIGGIKG